MDHVFWWVGRGSQADYGASLENWFPPGSVGSNPTPCATTELPVWESYEEYLTEVRGNAPITVKSKKVILKALSKRVSNLWDSLEVEQYIKDSSLSNGRKNLYGQAYRDWCNYRGFDYRPTQYRKEEKLPYIPTENEIDQLIGGMSARVAAFLQLIKESAFRPVEAWSLRPCDFNLPAKTCTLNTPAKNSRPRQLKMRDKLTSMMIPLICGSSQNERIFRGKLKTIRTNFYRRRRQLAIQLGNPNLNKITFKTLRHWKATMTYHKTKDILYTQKILGHKSLKNSLVYTHLVDFGEEDSFTVKVASSLTEFTSLLEHGFEYVSDYEDAKVLRKRK